LRAGELRQKDVAWPFKIVYILDTDAKVHYFGADVEDDMKVMTKYYKFTTVHRMSMSGCFSLDLYYSLQSFLT